MRIDEFISILESCNIGVGNFGSILTKPLKYYDKVMFWSPSFMGCVIEPVRQCYTYHDLYKVVIELKLRQELALKDFPEDRELSEQEIIKYPKL